MGGIVKKSDMNYPWTGGFNLWWGKSLLGEGGGGEFSGRA